MSAPATYARDGIGVWHRVAAVSSVSSQVTTACQHRPFVPSERLATVRPDPNLVCLACEPYAAQPSVTAPPRKGPEA